MSVQVAMIVTAIVVSMVWAVVIVLVGMARQLKRDEQRAVLYRHLDSVFGKPGFELPHGRHRKLKNYEALLDPQILVECGENGPELFAAMKCR